MGSTSAGKKNVLKGCYITRKTHRIKNKGEICTKQITFNCKKCEVSWRFASVQSASSLIIPWANDYDMNSECMSSQSSEYWPCRPHCKQAQRGNYCYSHPDMKPPQWGKTPGVWILCKPSVNGWTCGWMKNTSCLRLQTGRISCYRQLNIHSVYRNQRCSWLWGVFKISHYGIFTRS